MMNLFSKSILYLLIGGIFATESLAASSIVEVSYSSKTMNSTRKMMVYLPDGYSNNTTYYPTFYLMHGGGQRYYTWANVNDGNAKAILDQAISSGKAKPMIVVMPDVPDFAPDLFTRELCNDVIPFVEKTYRAKTDKDSRALAGLSWGGLQVLDAGLYRYDLFGYMGVFSSGWFIGDNVYNVMKNYLASNGSKIQKSIRYLYYGQGGTGDIAYNNGVETMKVLRSYGITVNYWEHSGAHSFVCWRQDLRDFLPFIFQYGLNENNINMPYKGVAHTIPGIIQAEEYDLGGNGVAYNDASTGNTGGATFRTDEDMDIENCTDIGTGYNLGYLTAGEWLEYTVNVQVAGNYDIDIRSACNGDGRLVSLSMEGVNIANNIAVANTGGWQTWVSTSLKNVPLKAGQQILRFTVGASDYVNINYIEFKNSVVTLSEDQFLELSEVYPNPFKDHLFVDVNGSFQFQLMSSSGVVLEEGTAEGKVALGSKLPKGFYLLKIEKGTYSKLMKLVKD